MNTTLAEPRLDNTCTCPRQDPGVARMLQLMALGHDQIAASRIVWAVPAAFSALVDAIAETTAAVHTVADLLGAGAPA